MKNIFLSALSVAIVVGLSSCNTQDKIEHDHHHHGHAHNHNQSRAHGEEALDETSADKHADEDSNEITLNAHEAETLGVATETISYSPFSEVIKVTGICEASPSDNSIATATSGGVLTLSPGVTVGCAVTKGERIGAISAAGMAGGDPNENARIAVDAAKKELDRLQPLHAEGIVSTKDFNAAEAEYKRALAAAGNARSGSSVTARVAGIITELYATDGQYVEQGSPVAMITANNRLTVKADVPVRLYSSISAIEDCNFVFPGMDTVYSLAELNGKRVANNAGRVVNGYVPVYFEIDSKGRIMGGLPVEVYLKGKERQKTIALPIKAVTEQQGVNFVYERLDEDCYRKIPVTLGISDGNSVEILSGVQPGMDIVTDGVIFVKLAESSGAVPEGHSHSH